MKITKKILSVLLALALMIAPATAGISAYAAANEMTFTVSSVKKAKAGDVVTVKVTLENAKPVCVINPTVVYDSEQLEFLEAGNGDVFQSNAFHIGDSYEGKVKILYYNSNLKDTSKNGTVCTLKFKVLNGAEGYADISLEFPENSVVNSKEEGIKVVSNKGSVQTVSPVIYAGEVKEENAIDGKYYQRVPLFASYRNQSVQLIPHIAGDTVKSVEWSVDTNRLLISEDGVVTPNRPWYCRANITAKITSKSGEVYEKTVLVEFYKFTFTQRLPVF
ncbi:MAG: hypothetical protein E7536_04915 [Ruminococcaceae bacterium]|nr:hypothetical protein [Oscillospiraceae bacterium]